MTESGVKFLYPGTDEEIVESVETDLINYMLQNDQRTLKIQQYRSEIRQRLNPRQETVVNRAVQRLAQAGYWSQSGIDTYVLS